MKHIENFESFLNEAKIGDMILTTEDLMQMLTGESNKKLDPFTIINMLIDPSAFTKLVLAVFSGGPKDAFLVMKNISNVVHQLTTGSGGDDERIVNAKASYENLVNMFFEEYPQFAEDDEELMNFTTEVNSRIKKAELGKQIASAKAEMAKLQDGIDKMTMEYDSM